MSVTLRPYQQKFVEDFERAVASGMRRIVGVLPTGGGKTVNMCAIIKPRHIARRGVLVLAHRREIIAQTSQKLHAHGIMHGIIQSGSEPRPLEPVQVASIQTLWTRAVRSEAMELPPADLLVIDECHHAPATTYQKIIDAYPNATLLGLTATPARGDGRGLGGIFEAIIEGPQVAELIQQGYLVKTRVYAPTQPDLKGVSTKAGDYVESQLAERMDKPKLVGDCVTHWHKYGERRKTVVFAVNVGHSLHLTDEFVKSGVRAEHVDGSTPKIERDAILARLQSGETEVVTNCMVLTEGWDMPEVGCCVLVRPTKKMGLFRQMIGRVLRPAEGKTDAIILDHSGAVFRHGFAEDPIEWTLDPDNHAQSPTHAMRCEPGSNSRLLECSQCQCMRIAGEPCPNCGFLPRRPAQYVSYIDGELGLVEGGRTSPASYNHAQRMQWLGMLKAIQVARRHKPGWIAHKFKNKFGMWPPYGLSVEPITPSPECMAWVRSQDIAYAKSRAREVA